MFIMKLRPITFKRSLTVLVSRDFMQSDFDKYRFNYEYGNESIEELCKEHSLIISELEEYITKESWTKQNEPDADDVEEVLSFYKTARNKLTVQMSKRALLNWKTFVDIEESIINQATTLLNEINTNTNDFGQADLVDPSLTLKRLTDILKSLKSTNHMYEAAVQHPTSMCNTVEEF